MKCFLLQTTKVLLLTILFSAFAVNGFCQDGKTLFRNNCAACHHIGKGKLVGPDLKDIHKKRSEEWLMKWVKSSSSMIKEGDTSAIAIFNEFNKVLMTDFAFLADGQIKSILDYVKTESENPTAAVNQDIASAATPQQAANPSGGLRPYDYIFIGLIVVLLLVVWQLSRIIRRLVRELIDVRGMDERLS